MSNVDKLIEYVIGNAGKLTPEKITALSKVIEALGGENETTKEPNAVPVVENQEELMTNSPIDFNEVDGIQVDDGPVNKVKIYG